MLSSFTRFSINFFTSIGLGALTDDMREFLKQAPKLIMAQRQEGVIVYVCMYVCVCVRVWMYICLYARVVGFRSSMASLHFSSCVSST